ncbi:MAG: tRNA-dihydrouridine synthase family protein [Bacteroidaceae bacterium]|jgi:nifR3 family TIM-barrel protein|nr:tRNA-dihydrouridine synthase family protein [Bacteroidaceae bacterium]MBO7168146.1 tRNA-dihydrouridine synthase family protein [Bacteroidaceae bacterium]MBQ5713113.1 tRNA-dihydrouridine synthase family protein [Bacteroidaceae bacterium]MBR0544118.1 tRNA-dihydrouridine synthase family protein [Bacteroidaceae bacterium]
MKIGNIDLGNRPVLLAPMEDVTDIGFRLLCRQLGAAMVYSEFVSSDALIRMVNKSLLKLEICPEERPVAIQIYGKDPDAMREAARIVVDQAHPDVLDINFGCPVKKVAGKGAGAGMLQNVPGILEITKAVVEAVPDTPVTVKTRLAWSEEQLVLPDGTPFIVDLAERLQDCGIKALTIHGRTRAQMYTGSADWTNIGMVKANPRMCIPIIGNGDITSAEETTQAFERYGVDAVMIGRATFGRPWIFHEIAHPERPLSLDEKVDILKQQVVISIERAAANLQNTLHGKNPELCGIRHVRRHLAATPLFKGIPNYRDTRIAMLRAEKKEEVFDLIEKTREMLKTGCTEDI